MSKNWGLYREYSIAELHNTLFLYKGAISQHVLSEIGEGMKFQLEGDEQIVHKFFGLFIELAQNIRHHSDERVYLENEKTDVGVGILRASVFKDYFLLVSGNYITQGKKQNLIERSQYVNNLSRSELREFYRQELRRPKRQDQKGANVGLIDMVRRSFNPVEVIVEEENDEKAFVSIAVRIDRYAKFNKRS